MNKKRLFKDVILSKHVTVCRSVFTKGFGLMFSKERKDFAYVFPFKKKRRIVITMCCVFYPIDIVFLDEKNIVVDLVENLKPFRNYEPKKKSFVAIELPRGSIKNFSLRIGNRLFWDDDKVKLRITLD